MQNGNIIRKLDQIYGRLTKTERKIADYIYSNATDAQYFSITQLAELCQVAEATVFRFCKTLGCEGYSEFKLALAKATLKAATQDEVETFSLAHGKVLVSDSFEDMCQKLYTTNVHALSHTMEVLVEDSYVNAARLLHEAKRVNCVGQGTSLLIALEAWGRFVTVSPKFNCIQDSYLQAVSCSLLEENDVILLFSYSGATMNILDVLKRAHENGVKVILVTKFEKSPASAFADELLRCGSNEGPMQQGSITSKMAMLLSIDVLFNEYYRQNPIACIENQEKSTHSISNKML